MNKIVQHLHSLSGQVLSLYKAIDRSSFWQPSVTGFIVVAALVNTVLYHNPLFTFAAASLDLSSRSGVQVVALLFMLVTVVTSMMLSLLSLVSLRLLKSVCMIAVLVNALASYFVETYGVVLD
ncbi:MAG: phosphoethanolamine transferase domain-containing protein, partial [Gammaproteobacteria bacterium]